MRLRHIEVFHAVYTHGSITAAANALHVSQPSVSKVLAHAEMQLGFLLFERVKGRLIPTNEAALLFEEVDRIHQQLGTVRNAAENIRNNDIGRIALALTPALGFDVVPTALAEYQRLHPQIKLDIQTLHNDQVHKHLHRHKSELAILFAPPPLPGIEAIEFGQAEIVAVYPRGLLPDAPERVRLEDVLEHPLIGIWDSGPLADIVARAIEQHQLSPSHAMKVQTYFIAVNLVRCGAGVCLVDEFTARSQLTPAMGLARLAEPLTFPVRGLRLSHKPVSRALDNFIELLRQQFKSP